MGMVQSLIDGLIVFMAAILLLFAALLGALRFSRAAKSRQIQKMRERLICLLSREAETQRMKNGLIDMVRPGGKEISAGSMSGSGGIEGIRGIRSLRGLQVISETADELTSPQERARLALAVGGEWYARYLKKTLIGGTVDSIVLALKLTGSLGLRQFVPDILTQIYCYRSTTQVQHIGMLSLCLLGAEKELVSICRDQTVASLLSFRTLEELFDRYQGDRERLCKALIDSAADQYIRRTCIKTIGERGYARLAASVQRYLTCGKPNVQIDAVRALGQLRYRPAYEQIRSFASDENWEMRLTAATALGLYGVEENIEPLLFLLCDSQWWVRCRAAEALTQYPNREELLRRVEATNDRFAGEMMRFALDKDALFQMEAAGGRSAGEATPSALDRDTLFQLELAGSRSAGEATPSALDKEALFQKEAEE
ncbi:MAG: HEAT repeat domain-containing protein [Clostridiaceae bacterium]